MKLERPEGLTDKEWDRCLPLTDELAFEAAMVLWEAHTPDNNRGAVQSRHDMMSLIGPLHIGWTVAVLADRGLEPFDWEFTPWFLINCTQGGFDLQPDWVSMCRGDISQ